MSCAPRVLIVEDDDVVRAFIVRILLGDGYCVTAVATACQAMAAVRNREFELIVLDFSLPDGDGLEITRLIRCEIPLLRILAISGYMVGDMPSVAIAAGASATLPKPTTSSALRRSVSELVAQGRAGIGRYKIAGA